MANPQELFHAGLLGVAGKVKKFVEEQVNEYDKDTKKPTGATKGSGRMTIHAYEEGRGIYKTGIVIGTVVIGGETYEVRSKEVCTLHPIKKDVTESVKGSAF